MIKKQINAESALLPEMAFNVESNRCMFPAILAGNQFQIEMIHLYINAVQFAQLFIAICTTLLAKQELNLLSFKIVDNYAK